VNTVTRTASGGYLYASDLGGGVTRFTVEREGHKLAACLLSWLVWGHL